MRSTAEAARAWLTLIRAPGVGAVTQRRLCQQFGTPAGVLAAGDGALTQAGLKPAARAWLQQPDSEQLAADLAWLESGPDRHLIPWDDPRFPAQLADNDDAPALLFVLGNPALLQDPQLALVGSRNPTPQGRDLARDMARRLTEAGLVVVSGLALGIDAAAHHGALDVDGPTLAVCGTGLDRVYPAAHRDLARRIAVQGALVSELPPGTPPSAAQFPRRNRIIAGMSLGTLVVEATPRSGSLITARMAADYGREVFAVPGSVHSPLSKGCHELIRQGAKLVEHAGHVLEELAPLAQPWLTEDRPTTTETTTADQAEQPAGEQAEVLAAMGYDPVGVDELVNRCRLTPAEVSSILLILELQGWVATVPGGRYQRRSPGECG